MTKVYVITNTNEANTAHGGIQQQLAASVVNDATSADLISGNYGINVSMTEFSFTTQSGEPNEASWPTGLYECIMDVSVVGAGLTYGLLDINSLGHFGRINNAKDTEVEAHAQDETAFSGPGVKTATFSGAWGGSTASDRFECLVAILRDGVNHGNQALTLTVNNSGSSRATFLEAFNLVEVLDESENILEGNLFARSLLRVIDEEEQVNQSQVLDLQVEDDEDDATHNDSHAYNTFDTELRVGDLGGTSNLDFWCRFIGVSIPKKAIIIKANLIFTPAFDGSNTVANGNIFAENVGNASRLADDSEYETAISNPTTVVAFNSIPAWVQNIEEQSPSIVDIIQQLVNLEDWGEDAINLFITDNASDDSAVRECYGHFGDKSRAVKLHVEFSTEAVSVLDLVREISEDINISTVVNFLKEVAGLEFIEVIDETVQIGEATLRILSLTRVVDSTVEISEALTRKLEFIRVLSETENISESPVPSRTMLRVIDETEEVSESPIAAQALIREVANTIELSEGNLSLLGKIRVVDNTLQLSEASSQILALVKITDETLQLSESIATTVALVRVTDETLQLSEATPKVVAILRIQNETINITEDIIHLVEVAGGLDLVEILNETVNIPEGFVRLLDITRIDDDTLQLTESILPVQSLLRSLSDTVEVEDQQVLVRSLLRVLVETAQLLEQSISAKSISQIVDDTIQLITSSGFAIGLAQVISDSLNISELNNRVRGLSRIVADTLNLTEARNRVLSLLRLVSETVQIQESLIKLLFFVRVVSDTINVSETTRRVLSFVRVVSEVVSINTAVNHLRGFFQIVNDTINIVTGAIAEFGAEVFGFLVGEVLVSAATTATLSVEAASQGLTRIKDVIKGTTNVNTDVSD